MASFIIHTISGEQFIKRLEQSYGIELTEYEKKQFLLGNLIVDSIKTSKEIPENIDESKIKEYKMNIKTQIRKEKLATHFRDPLKENECIKAPIPENFIAKYQYLLKENISSIGYLFHLFTDKLFFTRLFKESFDTINQNYIHTDYDDNLKYIKILKNNKLVDASSFWAGTDEINIYNDYTIINSILLEKYGTSFNKEEFLEFALQNFSNPGIEEVDYRNISKIINDTSSFIEESYLIVDKSLKVFDCNNIINFISYVVEEFMLYYKNIIDEYLNVRNKVKTR